MGRLLGIPTVYVESVTRIDGLSLSARMIEPVAAAAVRAVARARGRVRGPHPVRRQPLRGPMIVVTIGTNEQPFDRLIRAAARARAATSRCSSSTAPRTRRTAAASGSSSSRSTSSPERHARRAPFVCHAGVGSIMLARRCGHRPIVMAAPPPPRRGASTSISSCSARRLARPGIVTLVEDEVELAAALTADDRDRDRAGRPAVGAGRAQRVGAHGARGPRRPAPGRLRNDGGGAARAPPVLPLLGSRTERSRRDP